MNDITVLCESILAEARDFASVKAAEADAAAEKTLAEASSAAQALIAEARGKTDAELARRRERALSGREKSRRAALLAEKTALLNEVFASATDALALPDGEHYLAFVQKLYLSAGSPAGCTVQLQENRKNLQPQLSAAFPGCTFVFTPEITGGAIFTAGDIAYDCTAATLIADLRNEKQAEVAAILFGEADDAQKKTR